MPSWPVRVPSDTITPPRHRSTPFPAWLHPHSALLQGTYQCLILTGSICRVEVWGDHLLIGLDDLHLPFLDHETTASRKHSMPYARTQSVTHQYYKPFSLSIPALSIKNSSPPPCMPLPYHSSFTLQTPPI